MLRRPTFLLPLLMGLMGCRFSLGADISSKEWPDHAGDLRSSKYSRLDQIDATTVRKLKTAWVWESPDNEVIRNDSKYGPGIYKVTPIMVGDVLYLPTSLGFVIALEAATGREIWRFDTGSRLAGPFPNHGYHHRGVGYWRDGDVERILMPANDGYLWSLDARTGKPDPRFGDGGRVDTAQGLGRPIDRRLFAQAMPPLIAHDTIVLGSNISDDARTLSMPPGHIRAFDVRSGRLKWVFHTIPQQGEIGVDSWENQAWKYTGNTNAWAMMSADEELGYVYIPVGTPSNDWYGGQRLGDNLFAETLLCLDIRSGKRIWHFQATHHGLWDYDLPAAPNLVDITVNGRKRKAVAQVSKQAFMYVLDRITGEPIWPIEEKPVPQSNVPGERTARTQPFPIRPAPFDWQGVSAETLIDFTPELRKEALEIIERFDYGPLYTPPTERGTIVLPGFSGGASWTGASFDPDTGVIYVRSHTSPIVVKLDKRKGDESEFDYYRSRTVSTVRGPRGLPLFKPPYGRITAIDLNSGEHLWRVPYGEGIRQRIIDMGIADPGPVGAPGKQGILVTRTLLFLAQDDNGNNVLRAYDKRTGSVVHEIDIPLPPGGTPMTYMSGGRQYIALALGGGPDSRIVALTLP